MTDQPTTWTPERALAMFNDWGAIGCSDFNAKWGGIKTDDLDTIAIAALESAAAEIAKEKARADAMRKALIQCGRNVGGGLSDDVSDDFLMHVPEEARLVVDRLRAELAAKQPAEAEAAQQGPSDEEIAYALANDIQGPVLRRVLWMIARRAGVKL